MSDKSQNQTREFLKYVRAGKVPQLLADTWRALTGYGPISFCEAMHRYDRMRDILSYGVAFCVGIPALILFFSQPFILEGPRRVSVSCFAVAVLSFAAGLFVGAFTEEAADNKNRFPGVGQGFPEDFLRFRDVLNAGVLRANASP